MIRQVVDIYVKILRAILILGLGSGLTIAVLEMQKRKAKASLVRGLVALPVVAG